MTLYYLVITGEYTGYVQNIHLVGTADGDNVYATCSLFSPGGQWVEGDPTTVPNFVTNGNAVPVCATFDLQC